MSIMFKLTLRQLLTQRRRTLITLLGAIVSVAMIAAVSTFGGSFMKLFYDVQLENSGEWHSRFCDVSPSVMDGLASDERVKAVYAIADPVIDELPARTGRFECIGVYALDKTGFDAQRVRIAEGRLPESATECVISTTYAALSGVKLGDTITVGGRSDDNPADRRPRPYTVCGLASTSALEKSYNNTAFLLTLQTALPVDSPVDVFVTFKNPGNFVFEFTDQTAARLDCKADTNSSLLLYSGSVRNNGLLNTIYLATGVIMAIIVFSAISMIYNTFAISVTDRGAQFGLLSSIGATRRQRRAAVLFEACVISVVAIPLGLLFGFIGIAVTFRIVGRLMQGMLGSAAQLTLVVLPEAVIIAVVVSFVTIIVSAWIPAIRAARVSPMAAIRKTQDVRLSARETITKRSVKTGRLTKRMFGFEGELALKNLKRSRKRYRITIFSLVVSLTLFMSACGFTNCMRAAYMMTGNGETDSTAVFAHTSLWSDENGNAPSPTVLTGYGELERTVLNVPGADSATGITIVPSDTAQFSGAAYTPAFQGLLEKYGSSAADVRIVALDEASLRAYAARVGVNFDSLLDTSSPQVIAINNYDFRTSMSFTNADVLQISPGDPLNVTLTTDASESSPTASTQYSLHVAAVTGERPIGVSTQLTKPRVYLVTSRAVLDSLALTTYRETSYYFACPDASAAGLSEALRTISDSSSDYSANMNVVDYTSIRRQNERMVLIINIFIFGFITLLAMVSVINVAGTISTSLTLRTREFAMLRSVGMTPRAFARMMRYESLFYGLKTILYGVPASLLAVFGIYSSLGASFDMRFSLPLVDLLVGVLGIFVIVFMTMAYSSQRIKRVNVIEALRQNA